MLKRVGLVLATAAMAVIGLAPAPAQASGWWIQYSDTGTGLCMDVKNSSSSDGAIVQEYSCKVPGTSGASNQEFQFQAMNGAIQIVNSHSGKCVEIANWSTADGGTAQQHGCTGTPNQLWQTVYVGSTPRGATKYQFQNVYSGKCLTGTTTGYALYQYTCTSGNARQVWLEHLADSGCLTCLAGETARRD